MRGRAGIICGVAIIAVAMLLVPAHVSVGTLVWNFTPSIPTGLYSIEQRAWTRGDRVAVNPSGALKRRLVQAGVLEDGRLLLKRVAAVEGDRVCRTGPSVTINNERVAVAVVTGSGSATLPVWEGCVVLGKGDVFLLGETVNSFDGRYFGVTSQADIVGPVVQLLIL